MLYDTTDGAANMLKLSRLLGHERTTCIAHSLHNLLFTDSLSKVPAVQALIGQCKEAVHALHFKTYLIKEESSYKKEVALCDDVTKMYQELSEDTNYPVMPATDDESAEDESVDITMAEDNSSKHMHSSLKSAMPTRWNSTLNMIESIVDLQTEMNEALKRIGKYDLCIQDEDIELLNELRTFLTPFKEFTLIMSEISPNLSAVPLIRARIKKMCVAGAKDSCGLKEIKALILAKLDKRIPVTELVRTAACFDPCVRDVVMESEECRQLLLDTHAKLQSSR